jgi:sugar O-acyltransferase (sialic acid O-acetyltransferase NeuD family)
MPLCRSSRVRASPQGRRPELKRIVIIGAGGFAREVAWLIGEINRASPIYECLGFVVSDLSQLSGHDSRDQVLGDFNWLEANRGVDAVAFGIGNPAAKLTLSVELGSRFPKLEWPALVHPTVQFERSSCKLDRGVVLCAGTIGTVNLVFGPFCMVNLSCTIGHESRIGEACVLNPTVNISGGVTLERGVLVGTGAQVLQYVTVGAGATVGGGAVVTKDVEPGTTVVGMPAKPLPKRE